MQDDKITKFVTKTKIKLIDIEKCPYWDSDDACWGCPRFDKENGRKYICPFHKDQTFESQKKTLILLEKVHLNTEFGKLASSLKGIKRTKENSDFADEVKDLAKFMHVTYLGLSYKYGWKVQYNTDCGFSDLPPRNQRIMCELAISILGYFETGE